MNKETLQIYSKNLIKPYFFLNLIIWNYEEEKQLEFGYASNGNTLWLKND